MGVLQGSLLAYGVHPELRALDASVTRRDLGAEAWVDLRPHWLAGADQVFEELASTVAWQAERRTMFDRVVDVPRLAHFVEEGEPAPLPVIEQMRSELSRHYQGCGAGPFTTVGLCLYRDGTDSVAFHGDRIGRGAVEDTVVAIVSVGAPRRLLLRPRGGGRSVRFELGAGDLLVMGGSCQRTFEHAVPKSTRPVGARISIQLRPRGVR